MEKNLQNHCHHPECHCHHHDANCQCDNHSHLDCDCKVHQCECLDENQVESDHVYCGCGHHHDHCHNDECAGGHDHDHHHHHHCGCGHHHHEDLFEQSHHHGLTINFDGVIQADINRVWEVLTNNSYIDLWSDGIEMIEYRPGGTLQYQDETMMLLDIEPPVLLTFTWIGGTIAIELGAQSENETVINFSHWLEEITEDSAISLSHWMINLQSIAALAEGKELEERADHYAAVLPKMREMLALETQEDFEF